MIIVKKIERKNSSLTITKYIWHTSTQRSSKKVFQNVFVLPQRRMQFQSQEGKGHLHRQHAVKSLRRPANVLWSYEDGLLMTHPSLSRWSSNFRYALWVKGAHFISSISQSSTFTSFSIFHQLSNYHSPDTHFRLEQCCSSTHVFYFCHPA